MRGAMAGAALPGGVWSGIGLVRGLHCLHGFGEAYGEFFCVEQGGGKGLSPQVGAEGGMLCGSIAKVTLAVKSGLILLS